MENDVIGIYINEQEEKIRPILLKIRETIKAAAPDVTEKLSWQMPTFWDKENIIHFAAHKNHVGIYPGNEAMENFAERLTEYKTSKGAIQFPYSKPIDYELITEIVKWRIENKNDRS